jgi:hypothetical protein
MDNSPLCLDKLNTSVGVPTDGKSLLQVSVVSAQLQLKIVTFP